VGTNPTLSAISLSRPATYRAGPFFTSHAPLGVESLRAFTFDLPESLADAVELAVMNDAPRRTLRELIARHGPGLCSDARRCEGLLRDLCGAHRREINILTGALRERVPLDLLAARNSVPRDLLLTRLSKRLEENLALTEEAAGWAVESWALALGVVSDAELEESKRRRVEATPKPPPPPPPPFKDEPQSGRTAASSNTRPPLTPPRTPRRTAPPPVRGRQTLPPPTSQAPPVSTPTGVPTSPQVIDTGRLQAPSPDPSARGGRGRWRGCLVGCLLLVILSALLFVGGPFVLNILREEQQQRSLESPPVQTR
jgi:hypothetical protein